MSVLAADKFYTTLIYSLGKVNYIINFYSNTILIGKIFIIIFIFYRQIYYLSKLAIILQIARSCKMAFLLIIMHDIPFV